MDNTLTQALQSEELEILKSFIEVCQKLGLKYYLVGGTLIGAVRHEGFIPWDDDIDIAMLRDEYEVFLEKGQALLPEHLFLQNHKTDGYPGNFSKIRNSNTTFIESSVGDCDINHGVFIDIFPLDYYPEKTFQIEAFRLKNRVYLRKIWTAYRKQNCETRKDLRTRAKNAIWPMIELLFGITTIQKALEKRERLIKKQSISKTLTNHSGIWGEKEFFPVEWFGDGEQASFEGLCVTIPTCYDELLTHVYGDYMQLPPIEKRVGHHYTDVIDLERPYTYYTKARETEA